MTDSWAKERAEQKRAESCFPNYDHRDSNAECVRNGIIIELRAAEKQGVDSVTARLRHPDEALVEAVSRKLAGQYMREDGYDEKAALSAEQGEMWRNFKAVTKVAMTALADALEAEQTLPETGETG